MRPRKDREGRRFGFDPINSAPSFSSESPRRRPKLLAVLMAGQSRKWMILVATIWIQAFTGTNFDFSQYSSSLKFALNVSQVQLNYLATANDMGKVFGWSSGIALMHLPVSVVMFVAAFMGFFGYGLQWLLITGVVDLPYFLVISFLFSCLFCRWSAD